MGLLHPVKVVGGGGVVYIGWLHLQELKMILINRERLNFPVVFSLVLTLLVGSSACRNEEPSLKEGLLKLQPCADLGDDFTGLASWDGLCARLEVPENPEEPQGRKISLLVSVIPATGKNPAPDPLYILAGGPGQAATEAGPGLLNAFAPILARRDIVLVDQRGTGESAPLNCEAGDDTLTSLFDTSRRTDELEKCLADYKQDPRFYTTPIAMDDLDLVREALGHERINLWGGSYGTRAALVYARRHPDRVRTMILDGCAPPGMKLPLYMARDSERALDLTLTACEDNAECAGAFPGLRDRLTALEARLDQAPQEVRLVHPRTGKVENLLIHKENLGGLITSSLYLPEIASLLPLGILRAADGDFQVLATMMATLSSDSGISIGMHLSVICAEDLPWVSPEEEQAQVRDYPLAATLLDRYRKSCGIWPRGKIEPSYLEPVTSDIPTLILSGELDPVTPPSWGELVHGSLARSRHLIAPRTGHGASSRGCMPRLLAEFLDAGSGDGLDPECLEDIIRLPFFLSNGGPVREVGHD